MLKLSSNNKILKAGLLTQISYSYRFKRSISYRGILRHLKNKKKNLRDRWVREKAQMDQLGVLPQEPTHKVHVNDLIPITQTPDIPNRAFEMIDDQEAFFDSEILAQNIQKRLSQLQYAYPLGLNDISDFMGHRSGIQREHYNSILNALLEEDKYTAHELQEKLISFLKLVQTLKLYDLFRSEHFMFMLKNDLIAALDSLLKIQNNNPKNFFGPEEVIMVLEYVVANPSASFLLENIKYCSTIKQGLRPTTDSAKINERLLYDIFSPFIIKQVQVLPFAHSMMYLFPVTFLKVIELEKLFYKQAISIGFASKYYKSVDEQKYTNIPPEVFDQQLMKIQMFEQYLDQIGVDSEDEDRILEEQLKFGMDERFFLEYKSNLAEQWGPRSKQLDELQIKQKQYERQTSLLLQPEPSPKEEPLVKNDEQIKLDSRRFHFERFQSKLKERAQKQGKTFEQINNPLQKVKTQQEAQIIMQKMFDEVVNQQLELKQKLNQEDKQREQQQKKVEQQLDKQIQENMDKLALQINDPEAQLEAVKQMMQQFDQELQDMSSELDDVIEELSPAQINAIDQEIQLGEQAIENELGEAPEQNNLKKQYNQKTKKQEIEEQTQQINFSDGVVPKLQIADDYIDPVNSFFDGIQTPALHKNVGPQQFIEKILEDDILDKYDSEHEDNVLLSEEDIEKQSQIEPEYFYNKPLEDIMERYIDQGNSLMRFLGESFFNTPDLEHGLKSLTLTYLIIFRLTHYIQKRVPEKKMNVNDLVALAQHENYQELFTDKLENILKNYYINDVNVGALYGRLLDRYDDCDSVIFKPVIVTKFDQDFYSSKNVIKYGKFDDEIEYTAQPSTYLHKNQVYQTQANRANINKSGNVTLDLADSVSQSRAVGGYSRQTLDLMDSVLSNSSEGMYKLFKKTVNKYPSLKYQLNDRLQAYRNKGLNREQLYLMGLNEMTYLLYKRSTPPLSQQMFNAVDNKYMRDHAAIDALNQVNLQSKQGFISPESGQFAKKLQPYLVQPYVEQLSKVNYDMINYDLLDKNQIYSNEMNADEFYQEGINQMADQIQDSQQQFNPGLYQFLSQAAQERQAQQKKQKTQTQQPSNVYKPFTGIAMRPSILLSEQSKAALEQKLKNIQIVESEQTEQQQQVIQYQFPEIKNKKQYQEQIDKFLSLGIPDLPSEEVDELFTTSHEEEDKLDNNQQQSEQDSEDDYTSSEQAQIPQTKAKQQNIKKIEVEPQIQLYQNVTERTFKKQERPQKQAEPSKDRRQKIQKPKEDIDLQNVLFKPKNEIRRQLTNKFQKQSQRAQARLQEVKKERITKQEARQKQIYQKRFGQDNQSRIQKKDKSIMDILKKSQEKEKPRKTGGQALILQTDQDYNIVQPTHGNREQTKHEKRAAHEARKHYKRRDTEPDLTDKQRKQQMPFRRDKQRDNQKDDDDFTPKSRFSTMKPKFKFSIFKKPSSLIHSINNTSSLQEACLEIKNIFRRNSNPETLKQLIRIQELNHFKNGTQCLLAMFFYQEGDSLQRSQLLVGSFKTSLGEIQIDYNKYLKSTTFQFQLGDQPYIKLLNHLKSNFNRSLFKKVISHIIKYSDIISFELATELSSFVSFTNIPLTHLEFVYLIYKNNIRLSLSTLMILLSPLANYAETSKDVFTLYKLFVQKYQWPLSILPLQNYLTKLARAQESEYVSKIVEDLREIIISKKMKPLDKTLSSEDSKKLLNSFKDEVKSDEMKYVLQSANVLGNASSYEKAEQLFDQYRQYKPTLDKEQLKIGFSSYTMNPEKLQQLFQIAKNNKEFHTIDTFVKILQPIKKTLKNKNLIDKVLETFLYSGAVQKNLSASEVNLILQTFIKIKNTNSYPRLLEYLIKYELKLDENSQKLFYSVIRDAHTSTDSKRVIVNLLDLIFNKDRERERQEHRINREKQDQKKRKLLELKQSELKRIKENMTEADQIQIVEKKEQKAKPLMSISSKISRQVKAPQATQNSTVAALDKGKQVAPKKQKKKSTKQQIKIARAMKKEDAKANKKLVDPTFDRREILPPEVRQGMNRKRMRRGGMAKFYYLCTSEEQMQIDEQAKESARLKKRKI